MLYRLNPRFEFSEMRHTSSNDSVIVNSPSLSGNPATSGPYHSLHVSVSSSQPCRSSQTFRKFSSEPSLAGNPHRSVCGFRRRMESDCLEEEATGVRHNTSESRVSNGVYRMHAKKSCQRHDHNCSRHGRFKSHPKLRRPLSDCGARLNSSSPTNEPVAEQTTLSLSEEEIRSVCVDVFLER